jgi:hypothetical protein
MARLGKILIITTGLLLFVFITSDAQNKFHELTIIAKNSEGMPIDALVCVKFLRSGRIIQEKLNGEGELTLTCPYRDSPYISITIKPKDSNIYRSLVYEVSWNKNLKFAPIISYTPNHLGNLHKAEAMRQFNNDNKSELEEKRNNSNDDMKEVYDYLIKRIDVLGDSVDVLWDSILNLNYNNELLNLHLERLQIQNRMLQEEINKILSNQDKVLSRISLEASDCRCVMYNKSYITISYKINGINTERVINDARVRYEVLMKKSMNERAEKVVFANGKDYYIESLYVYEGQVRVNLIFNDESIQRREKLSLNNFSIFLFEEETWSLRQFHKIPMANFEFIDIQKECPLGPTKPPFAP